MRYPDELHDGVLRTVFETRERTGERRGPSARVAERLGIDPETLRNWVKPAEVDAGRRPGTSTEDRQLGHEVFELRRAEWILKSALAFLAAGLDRPQPR